jgi:hypothetical protein
MVRSVLLLLAVMGLSCCCGPSAIVRGSQLGLSGLESSQGSQSVDPARKLSIDSEYDLVENEAKEKPLLVAATEKPAQTDMANVSAPSGDVCNHSTVPVLSGMPLPIASPPKNTDNRALSARVLSEISQRDFVTVPEVLWFLAALLYEGGAVFYNEYRGLIEFLRLMH